MQNVLEQGPDSFCTIVFTQYMQIDVFNPNITTFQSNCAEGLHFSAFHYTHAEITSLAKKGGNNKHKNINEMRSRDDN